MISIEAFSPKLSAANIWRKMFDSETQLMTDSFNYVMKGVRSQELEVRVSS